MMKILFVCHGNICRSTMGEYILKDLVKKAGREAEFEIDSAAVSREEIGNPIYPPARRELTRRGVALGDHRARQVTMEDYGGILIGSILWMRATAGICSGCCPGSGEDPKAVAERRGGPLVHR